MPAAVLSGAPPGLYLDRPPAAQDTLAWAWDPDPASVAAEALVGPAGTVLTPVRTAGPPGFYTFGATDFLFFGDALGTTWANPAGFTVYCAINPSAGDIAGQRICVSKAAGAPHNVFSFGMQATAGKPYGFVSYDGGLGNYEDAVGSGAALSAAKHTLTMVFNPALAFGSRIVLYVDGASVAVTPTSLGSGTFAFTDSTASLIVGGAAPTPLSVMAYVYGYRGAHTAATVLSNYNWIHSTKGW